MATTPALRAIDRLRKAANLTPTKKTVELSDGTTFELWRTPLVAAERERAQKAAKSEDHRRKRHQVVFSGGNRRTQKRSTRHRPPSPNAGDPVK